MGMIGINDVIIAPAEVCPPCVHFDVRNQKNLSFLIDGALNDLISYAKTDAKCTTSDVVVAQTSVNFMKRWFR